MEPITTNEEPHVADISVVTTEDYETCARQSRVTITFGAIEIRADLDERTARDLAVALLAPMKCEVPVVATLKPLIVPKKRFGQGNYAVLDADTLAARELPEEMRH